MINTRRTIKDFSDETVDIEAIKRILEAGMMAPSTTAEQFAYALRAQFGDVQGYVKSILNYPDEYVIPCYIAMG